MSGKQPGKRRRHPTAKITDARFANFQCDPRFRLPTKRSTKTKIDKRFTRMLNDEDFTGTTSVDRLGRKLKSDSRKHALQRLYEEEDEEDKDEDDVEVEDDDVVRRELRETAAKYDPARGGGFSSSESVSDSDSEGEHDPDEEDATTVEAVPGTQRPHDAQTDVEIGQVTTRIAVVNLDWDHINSQDLMALFSSFVPKGGRIERVYIYPSEFGRERMQREEIEGPPKEIFRKNASESAGQDSEDDLEDGDDDSNSDEDIKKDLIKEGDERDFDSDTLRSYQLDRLRYYYAVVVCSDKATAEKIYRATDGTEYQSSSNFLDLRFIPDDVTFEDEPRDECDRLPSDYKPADFVTDALQHSKVRLTWDMHPEEVSRREDIKRAFGASRSQLEENDLRAYLASDSEEDAGFQSEADGSDKLAVAEPTLSKKERKARKMREALGLGVEPVSKSSKAGPVGDMQITFTAGLLEKKDEYKNKANEEETTVEKYMRKERERKARKKESALARRDGANPEASGDEVLEQQEDLGFDDPFFTADKPAPATKTSIRKEERRKRREARETEAAEKGVQRAQLERVMADSPEDAAGHLDHFDMSEIRRAEKQKSKKKKKKKGDKSHGERGGLQDDFEMDVEDNRFKAIFENHEFAIDPSNPRFKATKGMKQLLEEGRKRKMYDEQQGEEDVKRQKADRPRGDLADLVATVKKKARVAPIGGR